MSPTSSGLPALLEGIDPTASLVAVVGVLLLLWTAMRRRTGRPTRRTRTAPAVGDIWWADVPFEDGTGSKDRPCLVVETHGLRTVVLSITSTDKTGRRGWLAVERHGWSEAGGTSWLDMDRRIVLDPHRMRRYAGPCPPSVRKAVGV